MTGCDSSRASRCPAPPSWPRPLASAAADADNADADDDDDDDVDDDDDDDVDVVVDEGGFGSESNALDSSALT